MIEKWVRRMDKKWKFLFPLVTQFVFLAKKNDRKFVSANASSLPFKSLRKIKNIFTRFFSLQGVNQLLSLNLHKNNEPPFIVREIKSPLLFFEKVVRRWSFFELDHYHLKLLFQLGKTIIKSFFNDTKILWTRIFQEWCLSVHTWNGIL